MFAPCGRVGVVERPRTRAGPRPHVEESLMASQTLTDEQRAERRARERELVRDSVERLRSSDGWKQWLRTRSRFRSYSFGNQLLIAHQRTRAHCLLGEGEIDIRSSGFRSHANARDCWRSGPVIALFRWQLDRLWR